MTSIPITVAETTEFRRVAGKLMSSGEIERLIELLAYKPTAGDIIEGTGGLRKLRWALAGRGKRGGARVIYYYHDRGYPLLIVTVFAKNEKANLTAAERGALKQVIEEIKRQRRTR